MQDSIFCDDFVIDANNIWFPSKYNNTFYFANLETKEAKCLCKFSDEKSFVARLFHGIIKYKNKIFMFPCEANNIAVYDITTNTVTTIRLDLRIIRRSYWHNPDKTLFWKVVQVGKYIYAGGMGYKGIIKLDTETLETKCIDDWSEKVENSIEPNNDEVYIEDCLVDENYIYFPLCCMDAILQLNLQTDTTKLLRLNSGLSGFAGIEKWNDSFVLLPRQAEEIVIYTPKDGSVEKIKILYEIEKFSLNRVPFERHFILNDKLYVFRVFCDKNYVINLKNKTIVENEEPFRDKKIVALYFIDDIRLTFIEEDTRIWAVYNIKDRKYEQQFQLKMDATERRETIWEKMKYSKGLLREDICTLNYFLDALIDLKLEESNKAITNEKLIGNVIYEYVNGSC